MDEPTAPEPVATPATVKSRTSPWFWVALIASLAFLIASIAWPIVAFTMFMSYQKSEAELFEDDMKGMGMRESYYVEDESVLDAVEAPCDAMLKAGERVTLVGDNATVAASLKGWADTANAIVTAIDSADPDRDSEAWRDDWKATIAAVQKYANNLGKPGNRLTLPETVEEMYWSTDAECGVPISIAALDRQYAGQMLGGGDF